MGAGVGAGMNAVSIRAIAGYTRINFPAFEPTTQMENPEDGEDDIIDVEIIDDYFPLPLPLPLILCGGSSG